MELLGHFPPRRAVEKVVGTPLVRVGLHLWVHSHNTCQPHPLVLMVSPVPRVPARILETFRFYYKYGVLESFKFYYEYEFDYECDFLETFRFDYEYEFDYEYDFLDTIRFNYEYEYDFLETFRFDYEYEFDYEYDLHVVKTYI